MTKHVIITRPDNQQQKAIDEYRSAGLLVYGLPCFSIQSMDFTVIKPMLLEAEKSQVLIILSVNALNYALQIKPNFKMPDKSQVLAIGPAVKNCWQKHFNTEILIPADNNSESVIQLLDKLRPINKVSILTAAGGRDLIKSFCIAQQISFSQINTYQRKPLALDENRLLDFIKLKSELFLTASSCQIIDHLQQSLSASTRQQLTKSKLICGSARIAEYAKTQGFEQILIASSPANKDMIQVIKGAEI